MPHPLHQDSDQLPNSNSPQSADERETFEFRGATYEVIDCGGECPPVFAPIPIPDAGNSVVNERK